MASSTSRKWQVVLLPTAHALLFVAGMMSQSPFGASPIFCVDLPFSLPLVARDDWKTVAGVGIVGTAWWLLVGSLRWATRNRMINRLTSWAAAIILVLTCAAGSVAIYGQLSDGVMIHDERFNIAVMALYGLACTLLIGGFLNAIGVMQAMLATEGKL